MTRVLGNRQFSEVDQITFASLSGDRNPMHVDSIAARRIGAGSLVVHGIHSLLWCIERAATYVEGNKSVFSLRANFDLFVTTGDAVHVVLVQLDEERMRIELRLRETTAVTVLIEFGESLLPAFHKPVKLIATTTPMDLPEEQMAALDGRLAFATSPEEIARTFPAAAKLIGARRIAALGAFTQLIGMVCPGLNSIFNRLALQSSEDDYADDIGFRVTNANSERRRLLISVGGGGWVGSLTSLIRARATAQPLIGEVAKHIRPGEFADIFALVVGGSRGIGEVTAKMISAGGGQTIITYANGESDADRVAGEIRNAGGICHVMKLDVRIPILPQFSTLGITPNRLFYFATPMIGGRRMSFFESDRFIEFTRFYISGFYECCFSLLKSGESKLKALYPSSVFVEERPTGMVEYAMAKAAGEILCSEMNRSVAGFTAIVARLPRLATDQNPGLSTTDRRPTIIEELLPLIRGVCS